MRAVSSGVLAAVLTARTLGAAAQPAPVAPPPEPAAEPAKPVAEPARPAAEPARPAAEPASAAPTKRAGDTASADPATAARLGRHRGAWLLVGGSLALATAGAVLAYSSNTAERDVQDLYVGLNGTPPPFNSTTKRLYDDALAEGRRYEALSIVSFSLAGALAAGAALWFALDRGEQVTVAPAVSPGGAGVSTMIRF